jgi:hypothetical protein
MKNVIVIAMVLILTGCLTIVPPGYYQPHLYKSEHPIDLNDLAIVYGSCGKLEKNQKDSLAFGGLMVLS